MTAVAEPKAAPPAPPATTDRLERLPLEQLHDSPLNPRKNFDAAKLAELQASLLASGQLTPIVVRPRKAGYAVDPKQRDEVRGYEIAVGHRRFRAAKAAGLDSLLAVVRDLDDKTFVEILTIENLQRDDLHPLEEAQGFADLVKHAGYDVAKIAARIGKSENYVYDRLKLLQLIPAAKKLFLAGAFEAGHAIILARLTTEQQERALGDPEAAGPDNGSTRARESLLFRSQVGYRGDEELELKDRIKPVGVREFQYAVEQYTRATEQTIDPVLFPDSARKLEAAKEEKLSVIHITRDHRVSDDARDEKTRTYGAQSWERADGEPELDDWTGKAKKSKTCEWSRYGLVVAGRGQGEVFRVCVNKEKCKVHWPEQVAAFARRKKAAKKDAKEGGTKNRETAAQKEVEREKKAREQREKAEREAEDRKKRVRQALPALCERIVKAVQEESAKERESWLLAYLERSAWGGTEGARKEALALVPKTGDIGVRATLTVLFAELSTFRLEQDVTDAFKECGLTAKDLWAVVNRAAPPAPEKVQTSGKPKKASKAKAKK